MLIDLSLTLYAKLLRREVLSASPIRVLPHVKKPQGVIVNLSSNEKLEADAILFALGVKPNTTDLGLENLSLKTDDRGFLPVNDYCETKVTGLYAIGDMINGPGLAQSISRRDFVCGKNCQQKDT